MSLFHSSQHWNDTYVTRGFSPHICFGRYEQIKDDNYGDYTITSYPTITQFSTNSSLFTVGLWY
jgi:hypothetical protein